MFRGPPCRVEALAKTDSSAKALATADSLSPWERGVFAPSRSGLVGFKCTTTSYHYRNSMSRGKTRSARPFGLRVPRPSANIFARHTVKYAKREFERRFLLRGEPPSLAYVYWGSVVLAAPSISYSMLGYGLLPMGGLLHPFMAGIYAVPFWYLFERIRKRKLEKTAEPITGTSAS